MDNKYYLTNSRDVIYDKKSNPGLVDLIVVADECSDGFHTFDELYEHRCALFCALLNFIEYTDNDLRYRVWKSENDSDGKIPFNNPNWFIAGIQSPEIGRQITYHLRIDPYWEKLSNIKTLDEAPEYDGHTSKDVIERLLML